MHEKFVEFLAVAKSEKNKAFSEVSQAMHTTPQAIEKDFWVCLVLDVLFSLPEESPRLLFKGGTSLSKAYGLIKRFSEDIDFVVFRHDLGFVGDNDPAEIETSKKARRKLWEEVKLSAKSYIAGPLQQRIVDVLRDVAPTCQVAMADSGDPDGCTILVKYETLFSGEGYIAPYVKLEGGARSALDPHARCDVSPYIAEPLGIPEWKVVGIPTISPERTFLDKVILAHGCYYGNRAGRDFSDKQRLSRHYYDLAMIFEGGYGESALRDTELLNSVREHAISAFDQGWKRLELAVPGTLRVVPEGFLLDSLKQDYGRMQEMMFGSPPSFDLIMERLERIEQILNGG